MTVDESGGGREECTGIERSGKEQFFLGMERPERKEWRGAKSIRKEWGQGMEARGVSLGACYRFSFSNFQISFAFAVFCLAFRLANLGGC